MEEETKIQVSLGPSLFVVKESFVDSDGVRVQRVGQRTPVFYIALPDTNFDILSSRTRNVRVVVSYQEKVTPSAMPTEVSCLALLARCSITAQKSWLQVCCRDAERMYQVA